MIRLGVIPTLFISITLLSACEETDYRLDASNPSKLAATMDAIMSSTTAREQRLIAAAVRDLALLKNDPTLFEIVAVRGEVAPETDIANASGMIDGLTGPQLIQKAQKARRDAISRGLVQLRVELDQLLSDTVPRLKPGLELRLVSSSSELAVLRVKNRIGCAVQSIVGTLRNPSRLGPPQKFEVMMADALPDEGEREVTVRLSPLVMPLQEEPGEYGPIRVVDALGPDGLSLRMPPRLSAEESADRIMTIKTTIREAQASYSRLVANIAALQQEHYKLLARSSRM